MDGFCDEQYLEVERQRKDQRARARSRVSERASEREKENVGVRFRRQALLLWRRRGRRFSRRL